MTAPVSNGKVTIHERMVAILAELPAIGKTQKNVQQGFMFRGHDDMMNALNPLLAKHSVFVVPDVEERVTSQRTTAKGNVMFEVSLHVRYRFWGADGDHVEASVWGEGTDSGDKATSKAMTMAFKSALNQAFSISSQDNVDSDGLTPEETVRASRQAPAANTPAANGGTAPLAEGAPAPPEFKAPAGAASELQIKTLNALVETLSKANKLNTQHVLEAMKTDFGIDKMEALSKSQASDLIGRLKRYERNVNKAES